MSQDPLEKFVDAMIAAPLDANGNFARLEDATYAAHELVSVFGAFLEAPSSVATEDGHKVPLGALIPPDDLFTLQLMLAAIHAQSCTPERKAEAMAAMSEQTDDVITMIMQAIGILPPPVASTTSEAPAPAPASNVELSPKLQKFLSDLEGDSTGEK